MSSRRSSIASHHPELRKTSVKDLAGRLSGLAGSTRSKAVQSSKQPTLSRGHEKSSSAIATPKRPVSIGPRNLAEPNSVKNRRLLAELLQYSSNENDDDDEEKKDAETEKQDTSLWKALVHIKDRLEKLEVNGDDESTLSTGTDTHRPPAPRCRMTVHQSRLQRALEAFERSQPPAMARAMNAVVAETIYLNQQLWQSIPRDLDAKTLVALQKSSDAQLKALTETLLQLCRQSPPSMPSPAVVTITPPSLTQQKTPMSPVSEYSNSSNNNSLSHPRRRSFKVGGRNRLEDYPDLSSRGARTATISEPPLPFA